MGRSFGGEVSRNTPLRESDLRTRPGRRVKPPCTLATMAVYAVAYLILPFSLLTVTGTTPVQCNCPMCKADTTGTHRCACCDHGGVCTCGLSAPEDDSVSVTMMDLGWLPICNRFEVSFLFRRKAEVRPAVFSSPELPVAIPPPEA